MADVMVVYVDLTENLNYESRAIEILNSTEQDRASRFESMQRRRQFLLCRAALRMNLCEIVGCKNSDLSFTSIRNEKPMALVNERPLHYGFSVSHTVDHGMLAFTPKGRIGVDIEHRHVRHDIDGDIRKVFSKAERNALEITNETEKIARFLRLWTMKEAVIKATGEGFRADTTAFTLPDSLIHRVTNSAFVSFAAIPGVNWRLENLEHEAFAAAFAHEIV